MMEIRADCMIERDLMILDSQPTVDVALCAELMQLYLATNRQHLAVFFADEAANLGHQDAAALLAQYHVAGDIAFPPVRQAECDPGSEPAGLVCAAANARYFPMLLNLIGSLHKNSSSSIAGIVVGDLGLTAQQSTYLRGLDRVQVVPLAFPFAFQAWKFPFVLQTLLGSGLPLLYLDAGCFVERDLAPWFARIRQDGYLFFHNGPYTDPQHLTRNWTAEAVYTYFGLRKAEDMSVTAITTLVGLAPEAVDFARRLVAINQPYLLRPHADCIDNRYDQSLFSVYVQHILRTPLCRFEHELANAAGYGCKEAVVTIHRSKFRPGDAFKYLRARMN